MGVTVQLLHSEHRMAVFSAMMVGTVAGVAGLGTTIVSLARRSNNSQNPPRRQRASVTEVLNVDMVDRDSASQRPTLTAVSIWICRRQVGLSQTRCWPLLVASKVPSPERQKWEKWWLPLCDSFCLYE